MYSSPIGGNKIEHRKIKYSDLVWCSLTWKSGFVCGNQFPKGWNSLPQWCRTPLESFDYPAARWRCTSDWVTTGRRSQDVQPDGYIFLCSGVASPIYITQPPKYLYSLQWLLASNQNSYWIFPAFLIFLLLHLLTKPSCSRVKALSYRR